MRATRTAHSPQDISDNNRGVLLELVKITIKSNRGAVLADDVHRRPIFPGNTLHCGDPKLPRPSCSGADSRRRCAYGD